MDGAEINNLGDELRRTVLTGAHRRCAGMEP